MTSKAVTQLIAALHEALIVHADTERAVGQQRYMKSEMPYLGLTSPVLGKAIRPVLAEFELADKATWLEAVRRIWDGATHREYRYSAIAVLQHRRYRQWSTALDDDLILLLKHLIVTGAWWDYVDNIASHSVGDLLHADPSAVTPLLYNWAVEENLWLRRTSILCQLLFREETDLKLLTFAIEHSLADSDFFARKAIGWALREYSKTDELWVRKFVADYDAQLSTLSKREALKWLERRKSAT